ncbi:MAG TPA: DinB family protein [Vicinamibacteria bacterium]
MIARSWDGLTRAAQADEYADYVRRTGVTDLAATDGNLGVYLLRRREGERARFRVLSLWDSMEGIRRFAGDEPEKARYYPEDERFLLALEPRVEHFEVVVAGGRRGAGGEAAALADELRILAEGDAWHGPCLDELLADVSPATASARAIPGGHTLWEVVLHVAGWSDVFRRRLDGEVVDEPEEGDFPAPPEATAGAWADAKERLRVAHGRLVARVAALSDADLDAPVAGREYTARFLVRGAIRHTVYHSGQIGLLRKLAARS